ncbi:MAG: radical SAM protein [Candidatus Bathyarchaeia archaeon]
MGKCILCNASNQFISSNLCLCLKCIREKPEEAENMAIKVHEETRKKFNLPAKPPKDASGIPCGICMNNCKIGENKTGYCGLVKNVNGKLIRLGGTKDLGILEWYYDPLPTNCVAWWFCPGCSGKGYPKYSYNLSGPEYGYKNLAVFYGACSYDCLFCQNWHYRVLSKELKPSLSAKELAEKVDSKTSCICYFGGDPSPQIPHALITSEIALKKAENEKRILRICWETNGYMKENLAEKAAEISLKSGGILKFDLKFWNENLSKVLCGVSNKPSFENFKNIGKKFFKKRKEIPILTASTLLIPGYIDEEEVKGIASFIADIDTSIPYSLLAYYPHYVLNDLPLTSKKFAYECLSIAKKEGVENVRLGNIHLLV